MGKEIDIQVQEVQKIQFRINPKRTVARDIITKRQKLKIENIKSSKGKATSNIQRNSHKPDFSAETIEAKRSGIMYLK